jgi:fluoroquinolone resistance protein
VDPEQLRTKIDQQTPVEAASFTDTGWQDFDGEDARFIGCRFIGTAFTGTRFTAASFTNCQFARCRFSHADLRDTVFEGCDFTDRNDPAGCAFVFTDLRQAKFVKCDLSLCEFSHSDLFSIEMDESTLRGARFQKVDFSHAYSRKVVHTRATFRSCNLDLADLSETRLAECDLTASRLRETDLTRADLTGASLRDCDLFTAILTGTKFAGADLRGAEISGLNLTDLASFQGMKITQAQQHTLLTGIGVDVFPEPGAG